MKRNRNKKQQEGSDDARYSLWPYASWLFFFSVFANLLMLAMPLYLAQIYDRVLPTSSLETLVYLALLMAFILVLFGATESLRSRIAQRFGADFELSVVPKLAKKAIANPHVRAIDPAQRIADVNSLRQLFSGRGFIGLFDLPFAPVFLLILFFVHPLLGAIAVAGAVVLVLIALANERMTSEAQEEARIAQSSAGRQMSDLLLRMDDVRALGLSSALFGRWEDRALTAAKQNDDVAAINANFFGTVRFTRQLLQIFLLGSAAYLVINGAMSAGLIFAASMISGRALQPIEHVIGSWRQLAAGRAAWERVSQDLKASANLETDNMLLKDPVGHVEVDDIFYTAGGTLQEKPLLAEISFSAEPGEITAFVGNSGAGKSTLLRTIAGIHSPVHGCVRYDGFEVDNWNQDQLGRAIGYLGQDLEFFAGTIAENISRFQEDVTDEEVIDAAECAGVHAFIGSLADGYMTKIGPGGVRLSGGQKQRIALARAFFRDPAVLLLDEPDANLDNDGAAALKKSLADAKERGKTIMVVTHRKHLLDIVDKVLVLKGGHVDSYGPRDQVLKPASPVQKRAKTTLASVPSIASAAPARSPSTLAAPKKASLAALSEGSQS